MGNTDAVTLTRQQLYERVWATPMTHLAKSFHLSDAGLAKVCRKHSIPYPPRGYWAKQRHGKRVRRSPLPPCDDPKLQIIDFSKDTTRPAPTVVPLPEPEYDPDVMKVLKKVRSFEKVASRAEFRNPHPLVRATKEGLSQATPNEQKLVTTGRNRDAGLLNVSVARESVQRATVYLDTLIRTFEKVGGSVEIKKEEWHTETRIRILGESPMQIRLRERYRQKEKPKGTKTDAWPWHQLDYFPTGLFVLEGNPKWHWHVLCQDTKRARVEDRILATITDWITSVGKGRIARRRAEEARRVQEERDRIRAEQEREQHPLRVDLEQKQKQERERVESLLRDADSWHKSRELRDYIRAYEQRALDRDGEIAEDSESSRWLEWGRQQADRLDPLTTSPPSILDERIG